MSSTYHLYTCEVCEHPIDLKANNCLRLVTGWVRGSTSRTLTEMVTDHYRYAHDFCLAGAKNKPTGQDALF